MKKFLKRLLGFILILIVLLAGFLWITGRMYLLKAAWYNTADIDDYKIFDNRTVSTGKPQPWNISKRYNNIFYPGDLDQRLVSTQSVALALIQNDSLLFEKYWDDFSDSSLS